MNSQRRNQFLLIFVVLALTIYNVFPTLFYYYQPLKSPIGEKEAKKTIETIVHRTDSLLEEAHYWIASFCELIQASPTAIEPLQGAPHCLRIQFPSAEEAARFRTKLPEAGSQIAFAPARMQLALHDPSMNEVIVQRAFLPKLHEDDFAFVSASSDKAFLDRAKQLTSALIGPNAALLDFSPQGIDLLCQEIEKIDALFGSKSPVATRFAARLNATFEDKAIFPSLNKAIQKEYEKATGKKKERFSKAKAFLKAQETILTLSTPAPCSTQIESMLRAKASLHFEKLHPLFAGIQLNPKENQITLLPHADLVSFQKEPLFQQLWLEELAKLQHLTHEKLKQENGQVTISLFDKQEGTSFLTLDIKKVADTLQKQLIQQLRQTWKPTHPDLVELPLYDLADYALLSEEEKELCLVLVSPVSTTESPLPGFSSDSIYALFKGLDRIAKVAQEFPESESALQLQADMRSLMFSLEQLGFLSYGPLHQDLGILKSKDFLFEKPHFAAPILAATREGFEVKGTGQFAFLELSNLEERILTENRIDTTLHEELLQWDDEYRASLVALHQNQAVFTPKPVKSTFWNNFLLSWRKMLRGDSRKVLKWGLDLSGGKTVQLELKDEKMRPIEDEAQIKQGINELYARVNKMGVSEVSIRQMGRHIIIDFPGSQNFSASELIQASTMYFHIVNETFSRKNPELRESVERFLQEVWNEASVLQNTSSEQVQKIAQEKLHPKNVKRSSVAQTLFDAGLRLTADKTHPTCKLVQLRGDDARSWQGQFHPLMIVFEESALEGSKLENIRTDYDPSKGNFLSFDVQTGEPQTKLKSWTERYSKEGVQGKEEGKITQGMGWRMAVLLNDRVINAPNLDSPLSNSAMISGHFSPREVANLAADLKAGSLTYTPHILSETNVSPELGQSERAQGIIATIIAFALVIVAMIAYYRFAGLIASIAVLFNLLILWAVLQNLGAALTLAGLAGVILTVGMAVDANVLVFERIKEEFALSQNIRTAIHAGYKKAYSAILDSNVTTIIAALILLQFDAGPIKSFATNLIIGIASSMFTALFMTRFYFTGWMQNPKNTTLNMANWIGKTQINFFHWTRPVCYLALTLIAVGGGLLFKERHTIFGMDFTGGYSLNLVLEPKEGINYASEVQKALEKAGFHSKETQVRTLSPSNHLRLFIGKSAENEGHPFFQMPLEKDSSTRVNLYEKNPRIVYLLDVLKAAEIPVTAQSLASLHNEWSSISGQMSDTMRNHALLGLLLSWVAIFIYISIRFEYPFAAAALICLVHDVLVTIGCLGLLHALGLSIQIDLNTIAALMTIVGYSLNDTIIIFDRIREELDLHQNQTLSQVANRALNATLSRTTITSVTTLLVLLSLTVLGGPSIFGFALVMTLGVFFGTLSSWFIATPLALFFHKEELPSKTTSEVV